MGNNDQYSISEMGVTEDVLELLKQELNGLPITPFYVADLLNEKIEEEVFRLKLDWPLSLQPNSWDGVYNMGKMYYRIARYHNIENEHLYELFDVAVYIDTVKTLLMKKKTSKKYRTTSEEPGVCRWCWREVPATFSRCHVHNDSIGDEKAQKQAKSALKKARKIFREYRRILSTLRQAAQQNPITDIVLRVNQKKDNLGKGSYAEVLEWLDAFGGDGYLIDGKANQFIKYEEEQLQQRLVDDFGLKLDDIPEQYLPRFQEQALLRAEAWLSTTLKG